MNKLPCIYIDSDHPNLGRIIEKYEQGVLLPDDGTFNIPSQLHGLSDEYLWILLNGGMIHIFIVDWVDQETHQHSQYTNREDIEILKRFAHDPNAEFAEKHGRLSCLVTQSVINLDSIDKERVKTFWNDYYNHKLADGNR